MIGVIGQGGQNFGEVASAGVSPFVFRLDPTVTTQFGTARVNAGGAPPPVPTVAAMVDATGRPFIRFTSNDANAGFIPILGVAGTGRFLIEMRANWSTGKGAGQMAGIGFNFAPAAGFTGFAVTSRSADGTGFDSVVSGVNENFTDFNALNLDAGFQYAPLFVDVWLDTAANACTYTYAGNVQFSRSDFQQRRKVALETAGGTTMGLYSVGNTGTLDIAELIIWQNPRGW